jgi:kumamolisin
MAANLVPLSGSERHAVPGARVVSAAPPDERLEVTVRLRRRQPLPSPMALGAQKTAKRKYLTHAELEARHGADPQDVARVEAFARQHGLTVVESSLARRSVMLSGTVAQFNQAFGVQMNVYEHDKGTFRSRTGPIHVPPELAGVVEAVFGFDNRPAFKPHFRRLRTAAPRADGGPPPGTFLPPQLAKLYDFPTGANGSGQCIGILELGGGFRPGDLKTYFKELGLKAPHVVAVSVDHGSNQPGGDADGEVMLDIEVAAAVAPAATIAVYFAPNTNRSFLDALTKAISDTVNKPSVISISWGAPEATDPQGQTFMQQFDQALQSAAALGITVCVAAGDNGAADMGPQEWDNAAHVDFPASSPFALACGGTRLEAAGTSITRESVWNQGQADLQDDSFGASGGGVSAFFPLPDYQQNAGVPPSANGGASGRGVPDVAADGDPATGYFVRVDGQELPIGGTSAVAPLWAGLLALINQKLGRRVGFINPLLYSATGAGAFHDVTEGGNRVGDQAVGYDAGPGWDACTGLGSPDGEKVLEALS